MQLQWLNPAGKKNRPKNLKKFVATESNCWRGSARRGESLMRSGDFAADGMAGDVDERALFERFSMRLIGLARDHFVVRFSAEVDAEVIDELDYHRLLI